MTWAPWLRLIVSKPVGVVLLAMLWLASPAGGTKIVFVAGGPSHGYGEHEFRAGSEILASALREAGFEATVHDRGWPRNASALEGADAVVVYADGGSSHPALEHMAELEDLMARGVGLLAMHYAVEVPAGDPGDTFDRWLGGYYESGWSVNPVWNAEVSLEPEHPIARGVSPFTAPDEWYFNIRFLDGGPETTPIATAVPDDEARANPTWPRTAPDHILEASGRRETLLWVVERPDGGRGAGFTGGHFHWNWGNDDFRRLVLNTIVWVARGEVPPSGVDSKPLTIDELMTGQDESFLQTVGRVFSFDRDETAERFGLRADDNG